MVTSKNISMSLLEQVAALSPYTVGFERQFSRLKDFESLQKQTTGSLEFFWLKACFVVGAG